jgi:hypothetical protein
VKADATDLPPPARALIAPEPAEAVAAPSGRVLIAAIPDGRIGVINGNEFTPLNMPPVSGTVLSLSLGAGAGAW